MPEWSNHWSGHVLFALSRWLHLVAMTLLVGGTLFLEVVVPQAIDDLTEQQQLSIFARSRWIFRRIVWLCAVLLPITGGVSLFRLWATYRQHGAGPLSLSASGYWMAAHTVLGILAITLAIQIVLTNARPGASRLWLRLNLILMLAVMFMAVAARHVRLTVREAERAGEREIAESARQTIRYFSEPASRPDLSSGPRPTTTPATTPAATPTTSP